jgi:hypothetical protein
MTRLEALEQEVKALTPSELAEFRDWLLEFEWQAWDRQIEQDSKAGKLGSLASRIRADHKSGRTKPL